MGTPHRPEKALLFIGTLFSDEEQLIKAQISLEELFGEVVMEGPTLKWDYSEYYREEMGDQLFRKFLFFKNLIDPGDLAPIKLKTNDIETALAQEGKRTINLDPGYFTLAKVVLASTKNYSHRIYLRDGIFAEVTLIFKSKENRFTPALNSYRDYHEEITLATFMHARTLFSLLTQQAF